MVRDTTDNSYFIPWIYADSNRQTPYYVYFYMTSQERHEKRYQRRKAKREAKKRAFLDPIDNFDIAINRNTLSRATHEASLGLTWKSSVKRFNYRKLLNIKRLSDQLKAGENTHKNFICFSLYERGKKRNIMSVRFYERVPQKSVCTNILYPALTRSLIYDNAANQIGKGTQLARKRVKEFLSWHYRRYGTEGYALLIDFKSFFENLDHEKIKELLADTFKDERILYYLYQQLDDYADYYGRPVGLGLGSETNQIYAVSLPSPLDHFIKEKLGIHCYSAYMDDRVLIHISKLYLEECLIEIREFCKKYGFIINEKKTRIVKLTRGFSYLKTNYRLTETGHVVMTPDRKTVVRTRRRLKKFKIKYDAGEMTIEDIRTSYASARGSLVDRDSYRSIRSLDSLYNSLFKEV